MADGKSTRARHIGAVEGGQQPADVSGYRPITFEQAAALADRIVPYDGDAVALALVTLLRGIVAAHYIERRGDGSRPGVPDVEGLVMYAARAAYSNTIHFDDSLKEFVGDEGGAR